jgi:hypothetical protein
MDYLEETRRVAFDSTYEAGSVAVLEGKNLFP